MVTLGDVKVHVLSDGTFALDGGAMFGVVPRVVWEKSDPPDEKNRVSLGLNVALVESGGQRILVDTGMGDKWTEKERRMYRLDRSATLLESLRAVGLGDLLPVEGEVEIRERRLEEHLPGALDVAGHRARDGGHDLELGRRSTDLRERRVDGRPDRPTDMSRRAHPEHDAVGQLRRRPQHHGPHRRPQNGQIGPGRGPLELKP